MYKMGGGLMQLVAYGAQDIYLTGNPQITFFKVVYRRHTNFSMETIEQTINGSSALPAAGSEATGTVTISRNGDLLGALYVHLPSFDGTAANRAVKEVRLEIGGQEIDKQTEEWMEMWNELSTTEAKASGLKSMQGAVGTGSSTGVNEAMVPLQFYFCRNPGCYLPLIALQYHEVKIVTTFASPTNASFSSPKLWADYVYLDTDERRRFAQVSHEYLIEQVQHQSFSAGTTHDINFNHPVKELIWTGNYTAPTGVFDQLGTDTYKLKLNGHDRMEARPLTYYTKVQVYESHTGTPVDMETLAPTPGASNATATGVAVYSFALKPEEHQPSGTCNFSRIDNAQLVTGDNQDLEVYAVNYNVLRVMSGMGGLAYSN